MKKSTSLAFILTASILSNAALAGGSKVEIGGYSPVDYIAGQKVVYGDPKFSSEYKGKIYYLSNEDAKKAFDAEPAKFAKAIKYDSYCATGVAFGKKVDTDPKYFSVVDNKLYLFSGQEAKDIFDKDPKGMLKKAEANWPKIRNKVPSDL